MELQNFKCVISATTRCLEGSLKVEEQKEHLHWLTRRL